MLLSILDTACSTKGYILSRVGNVHAELRTIAKIIFDVARQILNSDNHLCNAMTFEQIEDMFHDWFASNRDHWFRATNRQWPQPRSLPSGHDNCFHRGLLSCRTGSNNMEMA